MQCNLEQHFISVFIACTLEDFDYVTSSRIQNVTNIWCRIEIFSWSESPNKPSTWLVFWDFTW